MANLLPPGLKVCLRVADIERAAFVFAVTCIVSSVLSFIAGAVGSLLQDKSAIVVASSSALISGRSS